MAVTAKDLQRQHESGGSEGSASPDRHQKDRGAARRPDRSDLTGTRARRSPTVELDPSFKVQALVALGLLFAMMLALVVGRSMIVSRTYELAQMREELVIAQGQTEQMRSEIAAMESTQRLSDIATSQLGMTAPKSESEPAMAVAADLVGADEEPATPQAIGQESDSAGETAGDDSRVVVLQLEPEREQATTASLQDLGWWLLRWLRGAPPVRAGQ